MRAIKNAVFHPIRTLREGEQDVADAKVGNWDAITERMDKADRDGRI